ncbi:MAG: hypothetical protein JWQ84_328 [Mucilaginibacter sp.]|nr:hypothetical protein [Mucilaginibacter sp.]
MNKHFILIAALLLGSQISKAQTSQGNQTLGFNFSFYYNNINSVIINPADQSVTNISSRTNIFNIGPSYSYFIADKLDLGASLCYSSTSISSTPSNYGPGTQHNDTYSGSIYLRKYFLYANKIGIRTGPYLSYSTGSSNYIFVGSPADMSKTNDYGAGVNLALVYFPSKQISVSAMVANLGYDHYTANNYNRGSDNENSVNFSFVNSLNLSVSYVFGNK